MKLLSMTIRDKVICLVMFVCVVVLLLAGCTLYGVIHYTFRSSMAQQMQTDAEVIANNCNVALVFENTDDVRSVLSSLHAKPPIVFAGVYNQSGDLFADYYNAAADQRVKPDTLKPQGSYFGQDWLTVYQPIILDGETIGTLVIRSDMMLLRSFTRTVLIATVIILVVALGLGYVLSARFQRIISSPVLRLAETANEISQSKDFSVRVQGRSGDELGQLIESLNRMLERIEQRDSKLLRANKCLTEEVEHRQETEQILRESEEKLKRSNQELQDFAYVASHDLREPLRKISAFGGLLTDSFEGKMDEDQQENLSFMIDGAQRMNDMIHALLTYSRVTTQGGEFRAVDLNEVVNDIREFELSVKIEETSTCINVPQPLYSVNGDQSQMRQLFQNLFANAIKYQKAGTIPEITIRSRIVDGKVRVEVQDNGIGMNPQQCKNAFIMFKRVHADKQYEGTGIGLAVCKKIVERHGGAIGVNSETDKGSTFWFILAAGQPASEQEAEEILVAVPATAK